MPKDRYESPLASRYASDFMLCLFSPDTRFQTWRRLWVALARAEHNLGLPVTAEQVAELEAHITDIDYETAAAREKEVRHDVMAHVYTYGKAAPSAAGIIHLGATSCYVTDNADLIIYREGLRYLRGELLAVVANLSQICRAIQGHPHPGLYPLSARPAGDGGQAGHPLDAGPALRPGGAGLRPGPHEVPGLPGHHRHRGQLSGPVRWRRRQD